MGELAVRGPQMMKDYFYNPVDRKKDIIKTFSYLVFPAEVEEVLRTFPDVAEAAVVGVPDLDRGELVKALVVLAPRHGRLEFALAADSGLPECLSMPSATRRTWTGACVRHQQAPAQDRAREHHSGRKDRPEAGHDDGWQRRRAKQAG